MSPEVEGDEQVRLSSSIQAWMFSWLRANVPSVSFNLKDLGKWCMHVCAHMCACMHVCLCE